MELACELLIDVGTCHQGHTVCVCLNIAAVMLYEAKNSLDAPQSGLLALRLDITYPGH